MAKKELEALIKAGACDFLGKNRGSMIAAVPGEIRRAKSWSDISSKGAWSLDGDAGEDDVIPVLENWPDEKWTKDQIADGEDETLEFYFCDHPLKEIITKYQACIEQTTKQAAFMQDKEYVTLGGIMRRVAIKPIKNGRWAGKRRAEACLEDIHGRINLIAFPDQLDAYNSYFTNGSRVVVYGQISRRSDIAEVIIKKLETLDECLSKTIQATRLLFAVDKTDMESLSSVLRKHPGSVPVYLHGTTASSSVIWRTPFQVTLNDDFLNSVEQTVGQGCLHRDLLLS